jgi:hypothetical protein
VGKIYTTAEAQSRALFLFQKPTRHMSNWTGDIEREFPHVASIHQSYFVVFQDYRDDDQFTPITHRDTYLFVEENCAHDAIMRHTEVEFYFTPDYKVREAQKKFVSSYEMRQSVKSGWVEFFFRSHSDLLLFVLHFGEVCSIRDDLVHPNRNFSDTERASISKHSVLF